MSFARLMLSFHVKCGPETSNVGLWMCNFKAEQKKPSILAFKNKNEKDKTRKNKI